jgi:hypothetical protein
MAQYIFPDANTQDVCLIQDTTGNVNLVLNGNLASGGHVSFIENGYSRQLSFSSASNLSSAVFTIYGIQNGVAIIETINGPNANTVYSVNIYDVVTNITSSIAVTGISIGTGHSGFFQLLMPTISGISNLNYNFTLGSTFGTNVIGTTVYGTLGNIVNTGSTFNDIITNNVGTLYTIKASGNETFYMYPDNSTLVTSILIKLTGSTSTIGNSMTLTFLQLI